jgi:hypothetical protein
MDLRECNNEAGASNDDVPIFHKMPGAGLAFSTKHDTSVSCPAITVIGSALGRSVMLGKTG